MRSRRLVAAILAAAICTQIGCGKEASVSKDTGTVSESSAASSVTETSVAEASEGTESVDTEIQHASTVSTVSSVEEEEKQLVMPEGQDLRFDYTTVKGIKVEKGATIAVVVKNTDNIFYKEVKKGAQRAIDEMNEEAGYKGKDKVSLLFLGADNSTDLDGQINTLDDVLQENPAALCLAAIDMNSCTAQLETAEDNAIPVIILDSGVESDISTSICASDNYQLGEDAAEKMVEAVGTSGNIMVISHLTESTTAALRLDGFREKIKEIAPDLKLIDLTPEDDEESLNTLMDQALEENPDIAGVFSVNIEHIKKAQSYFEKKKIEDLPMICVDCDKEEKKAIEDGKLYGTFCQNPYTMGYVAVTAALHAAAGEEIDPFINTGYIWVDSSNVDTEQAAAYMIDE